MTVEQFAQQLLLNLPYEANSQQIEVIAALARFCSASTPSDSVFMLCGYAGTGKTSLVGTLVRTLRQVGLASVLMAPTGRAAKVFSAYSGYPAWTIHRTIYRPPAAGKPFAAVMDNQHSNTFFIVDEASMIGSAGSDGGGTDLLADLIHYVYTGSNCRLILLGDTAQLPPVGCTESPALSVSELKTFGLRVSRALLTDTVRQSKSSGILYNATTLRAAMRLSPLPQPQLHLRGFDDVVALPGEELQELLAEAYATDGVDDTIIVTRANWRATQFNLAIRSEILGREEELSRDDLLLVAKNNYHWSARVRELDFIANGDTARVVKVYGTESRYGFRFADVRLAFDYAGAELDCKILLDCLTADAPALTAEQQQALFQAVYTDPELFTEYTPNSVRMKALRTNPYYQALQVKYAYAVTCHKAQGGQWTNVVVDLGSIPPEALTGMDFYRWLYTATTRATTRLFYLNPPAITDL